MKGPLSLASAADFLARHLGAQRAGAWEIYLSETQSLSIEAQGGEVEAYSHALSRGVGIRTLVDGAPGYSHTTDLRPEGLRTATRRSIEAARLATPDPATAFPTPSPLPRRDLKIFDPSIRRLSAERKIALALELEDAARSADPRIQRVRNASYTEDLQEVRIENSLGLRRAGKETSCSLSVMAVAGSGDDAEVGYDFSDARFVKELRPRAVGEAAARRALQQLGGKVVRGRTGPLVLENLAACELLEILAPSFCADQVQKGLSGLAGKLGRRVFGAAANIVDDGLLPKAPASFPFDDEGVPRRRTPLVTEGILEGYLYDLAGARRAGRASSTGSAARGAGFAGPPRTGTSNLVLRPGKKDLPALLGSLGRGLFVTELLGVHTANPVTGEFSAGCAGQIIERGISAGPFKGMAVSGNLFDLFLAVEEAGSDLRFSGGTGCPSLLVGKASVSGE